METHRPVLSKGDNHMVQFGGSTTPRANDSFLVVVG